uniref:Prepronociceptin a n=1 Tax=Neogobius melanostomus TaxID=47308 RepID=A0A8C6TI52_9GOBI
MKTAVALLLLCLCDLGQSDCQADCVSCSHILPKRLSFNTVVCLIECEGNVSPAFSWDFCRKALLRPFEALKGPARKRSREEVESLFPDEEEPVENDLLLPVALQRFDHVARSFGLDESDTGDKAHGDVGLSVSKRFGGFVKGRHGYKKIMSPGRSYQKRYGGFIGIRKSARKWNNQKRFSEFLKQYLGMSARATEFNSMSEDLTSQNEI